MEGIGDTIRVSLTDNPVQEVYAVTADIAGINPYLGSAAVGGEHREFIIEMNIRNHVM